MIRLLLIYVLILVLFKSFDVGVITDLINSVISYVSNTTIGGAIRSVFRFIGNLIDLVLFNSESTIITSTGINLGNLVWFATIVRIVIVFLFIKLLIKVVLP